MTTLAITPNWKNKTAKFRGTVAAGEHVAVTIQNDNSEGAPFIGDASTLRLRVVDPASGRTLAIFPEPVPEGETPEEWDSDLSPLRCTLNLNTVQMLKSVPPAANVPLLFVLDDYENKTLYFKEQLPVEHWPRLRGEEEPTDLDNYKDIIADFNTRLDGYDARITAAENVANAATESASAAVTAANQAISIANQAVDKAETAHNSAAASAEAAYNSALAAEEAQEAAESAAESINSPDATLTEEGVAADAKATGDAIAAEKERAETAEAAEESRAKAAEADLADNVSSAQKAISDEAELRAAADADLEANKADKSAVAAISVDVAAAQAAIVTKADRATTYTKSEVDSLIEAISGGGVEVRVVESLPQEGIPKVLYFVPRDDSETRNIYDEYMWISSSWEKIGSTDIDLSGYYQKPSGGIPKSDLSAGVQASLDKADKALPLAGGTMTGPLNATTVSFGLHELSGIGDALIIRNTLRGSVLVIPEADRWDILARLTDIYTAIQQIAPDFTAKTYAVNDLCTHSGVVYRCKSGYTATSSSLKPNSDTTHWEAKKVSELFAPLASPAFTGTPTAPTPTSGDNSTKIATTAFVKAAVDGVPLRYDMPTAVALVAENDEATLVHADRAVTNATIAAGFSTLNLTFPDAISGKVRDFYLRITVAAGESAPALSIPQGITIENPDGAVPEIADGETSAASTTLVWFSETAPNVFTAKSETVKAVA